MSRNNANDWPFSTEIWVTTRSRGTAQQPSLDTLADLFEAGLAPSQKEGR